MAIAIANNLLFFEGIKRSSSILTLELIHCQVGEEGSGAFFNSLGENNTNLASNLTGIVLRDCSIGNGGIRSLSKILRRCTNLERLAFIRTDGVDQHLQKLVSSIREDANQIETLALDGIAGNVGCEALISLLQDRNSNIYTLRLGMKNVDKDNTTPLVNILAWNSKLNCLFLEGNIGTDDFDWEALS